MQKYALPPHSVLFPSTETIVLHSNKQNTKNGEIKTMQITNLTVGWKKSWTVKYSGCQLVRDELTIDVDIKTISQRVSINSRLKVVACFSMFTISTGQLVVQSKNAKSDNEIAIQKSRQLFADVRSQMRKPWRETNAKVQPRIIVMNFLQLLWRQN